MTPEQARALKVGEHVVLPHPDGNVIGEVVEKDYARIKVQWEDGLRTSYAFDNWIVERMEILG